MLLHSVLLLFKYILVESKRKVKRDSVRRAGIPSTIAEGMAETYNKPASELPQPWDIDWSE